MSYCMSSLQRAEYLSRAAPYSRYRFHVALLSPLALQQRETQSVATAQQLMLERGEE